jgi:hypothetical protein
MALNVVASAASGGRRSERGSSGVHTAAGSSVYTAVGSSAHTAAGASVHTAAGSSAHTAAGLSVHSGERAREARRAQPRKRRQHDDALRWMTSILVSSLIFT